MTGREVLDRLNACATAQDVMDFAKESGFEVTEERALALLGRRDELSDAVLAGVSGGSNVPGGNGGVANPFSLDELTPQFIFGDRELFFI